MRRFAFDDVRHRAGYLPFLARPHGDNASAARQARISRSTWRSGLGMQGTYPCLSDLPTPHCAESCPAQTSGAGSSTISTERTLICNTLHGSE